MENSNFVKTSDVKEKANGKFSVGKTIEKMINDSLFLSTFTEPLLYLLQVEAEKESVNLGKNLINKNFFRFRDPIVFFLLTSFKSLGNYNYVLFSFYYHQNTLPEKLFSWFEATLR